MSGCNCYAAFIKDPQWVNHKTADFVRTLAQRMGNMHWKRNTKKLNIEWIVGVFTNTHAIELHDLSAVIKLQRWWRNRHKLVFRGPWHVNKKSVNTEDIYTLESLNNLPEQHIFSYTDDVGAVYAFNAPELWHDIQLNDGIARNPYTRVKIPAQDASRLQRMMQTIPQKQEEGWTSVEMAYVHALSILERVHGIYCKTEWMAPWNKKHIVKIFYEFHQNCAFHTIHFNLDMLKGTNVTHYKYSLAKEMIRLCNDKDDPHNMYLVCNMLFTFANNSRNFRTNLPQWVMLGASSM